MKLYYTDIQQKKKNHNNNNNDNNYLCLYNTYRKIQTLLLGTYI